MRIQYDEISPITGNKTVLIETDPVSGDEVKLCMESGYQTYLNFWKTTNTDIIDNLESQFPFDVVDSKIVDANGNVWYKAFLISPRVLLYPDADTWKVSNLIEINSGECIPIEVPIAPGQTATRYLDEETSAVFNKFEFEDALFEFQKRIAENQMKNEN